MVESSASRQKQLINVYWLGAGFGFEVWLYRRAWADKLKEGKVFCRGRNFMKKFEMVFSNCENKLILKAEN